MVYVGDKQREGFDEWLRHRFDAKVCAHACALRGRYVVIAIGRAGRTVQAVDLDGELVELIAQLPLRAAGLTGLIEMRAWLDAPTYERALAAARLESVRLAPEEGQV